MLNSIRNALVAVMALGMSAPALAADLYEPPIEEAPPIVEVQPAQYGGWYIRGDLDYHWSKFHGAEYVRYGDPENPGTFDFGKLKGAFSVGGGVGYQINNHFRTDVTLDWMSKSKFRGQTTGECGEYPDTFACSSVDSTSYRALLLLANAYVDIGTWHGITPYVGGGIGGAWLKWDTLHNKDNNGDFYHGGGKGWRFAYALAAGASYCLTKNVDLDVGYRYSRISGGKMFNYADANGFTGAGPGYDKGISTHEVRGGLRYNFGGSSKCAEPEIVAYEPEPVYTK